MPLGSLLAVLCHPLGARQSWASVPMLWQPQPTITNLFLLLVITFCSSPSWAPRCHLLMQHTMTAANSEPVLASATCRRVVEMVFVVGFTLTMAGPCLVLS